MTNSVETGKVVEATARPWVAKGFIDIDAMSRCFGDLGLARLIWHEDFGDIAYVPDRGNVELAEAHRRLIVTAVNCHDDLLEACELFAAEETQCYCDDTILIAEGEKCKVCIVRAAIAKAKAGAE